MNAHAGKPDENQTPLAESLGGRLGGWKRFTTRLKNHTRSSQRHADADLSVDIQTNPNARNDVSFWIEETFETASGQSRTHSIGFTLTAENVEKLRAILAEIDTAKVNP